MTRSPLSVEFSTHFDGFPYIMAFTMIQMDLCCKVISLISIDHFSLVKPMTFFVNNPLSVV